MKQLLKLSLALACSVAAVATAQAAISVSATPGAAIYAGPTPTYNFDTPTPFPGSNIFNTHTGNHARPLGSTGGFGAVGFSDGSPAILSLASFTQIGSISLLWGSIDTYNTLTVLDKLGNALQSFTGSQIAALVPGFANGNQSSLITNPLVTLKFTGGTEDNIGGLRFESTANAFEFDNITISAVPEPATWLMMIAGFGMIGGMMRRRNGNEGLATA